MPASAYLTVGPQTGTDGAVVAQRAGRTGEGVFTELQARYAEQTIRGNTFLAANTGAQAVSVALATTYTGLCLSNPVGSARNLILIEASYALTVAPAAIASIHLIGGSSATTQVTHTTPITPTSAFLGSSFTAAGKADSAATIPTPIYLDSLMGGFTAAALPSSPNTSFEIAGRIVLAPGGFVAIGALTAVTGIGSFTWVEVAV
jgi:hypothetical protein